MELRKKFFEICGINKIYESVANIAVILNKIIFLHLCQ